MVRQSGFRQMIALCARRRMFGLAFLGMFLGIQLGTMPALAESGPDKGRVAEPSYETPVSLRASETLPLELLRSRFHTVMEEVTNDGYLNFYRIYSDFGQFEIYGRSLLARRVYEIHALAELEALSKREVFFEAAKDAAIAPVEVVETFSERPVETLKGIPGGTRRLFERLGRQAREGVEKSKEWIDKLQEEDDEPPPEEVGVEGADERETQELLRKGISEGERYVEKRFGVRAAERRWARKLGTDPYTTNERLRRAIYRVAWVDSAGRFSLGLAGLPAIPGVKYLRKIDELVWGQDTDDLDAYNRARLADLGVDEATIETFYDNPHYSPSGRTWLIELLHGLQDVSGVGALVDYARAAESETDGRFITEGIEMLAWFHETQDALAEIRLTALPIARTVNGEKGRWRAFGAVDHLYWTEEVAAMARAAASQIETPSPKRRSPFHRRARERADDLVDHEIWLLGTASPRAVVEFAALGWVVRQDRRPALEAWRDQPAGEGVSD